MPPTHDRGAEDADRWSGRRRRGCGGVRRTGPERVPQRGLVLITGEPRRAGSVPVWSLMRPLVVHDTPLSTRHTLRTCLVSEHGSGPLCRQPDRSPRFSRCLRPGSLRATHGRTGTPKCEEQAMNGWMPTTVTRELDRSTGPLQETAASLCPWCSTTTLPIRTPCMPRSRHRPGRRRLVGLRPRAADTGCPPRLRRR